MAAAARQLLLSPRPAAPVAQAGLGRTSTVRTLFASLDLQPSTSGRAVELRHARQLLLPVEEQLRARVAELLPIERPPAPAVPVACPCAAPPRRHAPAEHLSLWSASRVAQRHRHLQAMAAAAERLAPPARPHSAAAGVSAGAGGSGRRRAGSFGSRVPDRMRPYAAVPRAPAPGADPSLALPVRLTRVPVAHTSAAHRGEEATDRAAVAAGAAALRPATRRAVAVPGWRVAQIGEVRARWAQRVL